MPKSLEIKVSDLMKLTDKEIQDLIFLDFDRENNWAELDAEQTYAAEIMWKALMRKLGK